MQCDNRTFKHIHAENSAIVYEFNSTVKGLCIKFAIKTAEKYDAWIRYTLNAWATYDDLHICDCEFLQKDDELGEIYSAKFSGEIKKIEFALCLAIGDDEYWDNNNKMNYIISDEDDDELCQICYTENINILIMPCLHNICDKCLLRCMKKYNEDYNGFRVFKCEFCRIEITYVVPDYIHIDDTEECIQYWNSLIEIINN